MLNREYENQQVTTDCTFSLLLCITFWQFFGCFSQIKKNAEYQEDINFKVNIFVFL